VAQGVGPSTTKKKKERKRKRNKRATKVEKRKIEGMNNLGYNP
jgi:hypothetical protein